MQQDNIKNILLFISCMMAVLLIFEFFNTRNNQSIQLIKADNTKTIIPSPDYRPDKNLEINFENKDLIGTINLNDGSLNKIKLKSYQSDIDIKAIFGWQDKEKNFTKQDNWKLKKQNNNQIIITTYNENIEIERLFSFKENYLIEVTDTIINQSDQPYILYPYSYLFQNEKPKKFSDSIIMHQGIISVNNNTFNEISYSDIKLKTKNITDDPQWVGIASRFWLASLIKNDKQQLSKIQITYNDGYIAGFTDIDPYLLNPKEQNTKKMSLYLGPKDLDIINDYATKYEIPLFSSTIDWGWFFFITKPIYSILDWLININLNPVLSIFIIILLLKVLLLPLSYKGQITSLRMKDIQPKLEEIKNKYTNNHQKISEEIIKLYKKYNINPVIGILSLLIQIPIFFSIYRVTYMSLKLQNVQFLWINDLANADNLSLTIGWLSISMLAVIAGITMMIQIINNGQSDYKMAIGISLFVVLMISELPTSVLLYIISNNIITLAQQILINIYIKS